MSATSNEAADQVMAMIAEKLHHMSFDEKKEALMKFHTRMETEKGEYKAREETTRVASSASYMRGVQEGIDRTLHQLVQL